ncbi:hypothetical protein CHLNCDRAFT_141995 [Chlorella variabilis]|uniref:5-methyltetrahydropteroyltriglutamate--homocysteine S-methyltransferase n=1 Tax=Chlorella variabilis TaxID=554065 RepID=E1Z7H8_CHLVA|nr:hypothetical protein CHLNCDRAFT_141995 [Chlorella variabilis]EFN57923.1 hypothetical protein CHLNCDRAFT_141995 [Chlorella variabilis]|eukprot:XP_005850025.1 hypothetical protein CHLNCDRAFT_141995 [Chlorella variabilis]
MATISTCTIGFPRIGSNREMKKALEAYWAGSNDAQALLQAAAGVEADAWRCQARAGIQLIALDSTLYDHALQERSATGAPAAVPGAAALPVYFAMARGAEGAPACDMSKHFDSNYHHIVPELDEQSEPRPDWSLLLDRVKRGQEAVGRERAVPMVVGPSTLLGLARGSFDRSSLLARLAPAYAQLLRQLAELGVPEVQIHEPILTMSGSEGLAADCAACYAELAAVGLPINIVVAYDDETYKWLVELPVAALSLDFLGVPGAEYGSSTAQHIAKHGFPKSKRLGAGVIDGRGIWADQGQAARLVASLRALLGEEQRIATSTSLQHVPYDLAAEEVPPAGLARPLAFAVQKLGEVVGTAAAVLGAAPGAIPALDLAAFTGAPGGAPRELPADMFRRPEPYAERRPKQVQYPPFPTTTIGSFPQTPAIRRSRLAFKKGRLSQEQYREKMAGEIGLCIGVQEALGLDVLVHGEPERSDMVEYFGLKLGGYHFTEQGWVQSYGSRYVRPPIVTGDISRSGPMTVHEYELAQGLTSKPVKGMLTGPVTILQWSFPRRDATRRQQAEQLALALRDEVADLQAAGCRVDEPALREGLPLKAGRRDEYLRWAVGAFRLATACAMPEVQVVTHLCYSDFADIMPAIEAMDADVLTIENSRSGNEMIAALAGTGYPRDVGPGVYDVHSPVVPTVGWLADRIRSFLEVGLLEGDACRIHVNPDCGLKTRRWEEVLPSLRNMVAAAHLVRAELAAADRLRPRRPTTPYKPHSGAAQRSASCAAPCCAP